MELIKTHPRLGLSHHPLVLLGVQLYAGSAVGDLQNAPEVTQARKETYAEWA